MTSTTFAQALNRSGVTCPNDLLADLAVPVHTEPQRQGDVAIWPCAAPSKAMLTNAIDVPPEGVHVVRGETSGRNSHILHTDTGRCQWIPAPPRTGDFLLLGTLVVHPGSVAMLIHTDEHGVNAVGPGTYRLTGKREQADEIRRVAD